MRSFIIFFISSFCIFANASDPISTFPISLGKPLRPAQLQIVWGVSEIKKVIVNEENGKEIQVLNISGDWTNLGAIKDHVRRDIVRSADANFDGFPDLLIESSNGSAGQLFKLFKFHPATKEFTISNSLDEVWNPTFDDKQKIIQGEARDMKPKFYFWLGDELKLKK